MPRNVDSAKEELVAGGHYVSFRMKSMISRQRDLPLLIISSHKVKLIQCGGLAQ